MNIHSEVKVKENIFCKICTFYVFKRSLQIFERKKGVSVPILSALLNLSKSKRCNLSVNGSFLKSLLVQITTCSIRARKRIESHLFYTLKQWYFSINFICLFDYTFSMLDWKRWEPSRNDSNDDLKKVTKLYS